MLNVEGINVYYGESHVLRDVHLAVRDWRDPMSHGTHEPNHQERRRGERRGVERRQGVDRRQRDIPVAVERRSGVTQRSDQNRRREDRRRSTDEST